VDYRKLGSSELTVSTFALGAMTFGSRGPKAIARLDQDGADMLVGAALDAGVTLFDTADIYTSGESEMMLGKALGTRRKDVVIATKVGLRSGADPEQTGLSAAHIARSAEASLKRLGTDYIDLYLAHRIDPSVSLEETLGAFDALVRAGKVRQVGFSNWPAWLAAKAIAMQKANGWQPLVAGQIYYSLVDREIELDLAPCGLSEGFGLMIFSPLAMGRLTGKYHDGSTATGRITDYKTFTTPDEARLDRIVSALRRIAADKGATPAQIALAWLAARPAVATILVGATSLDQLKSNVQAAQIRLTAEDMEVLSAASAVPLTYPASALSAALSPEQYEAYMTGKAIS
jgi:aryl-alcohol dehydrogenase-like predicted oxidoreductase